ncbi:hypothetical protein ACWENO_13640 [Streptomyces sp. NPDC004436]
MSYRPYPNADRALRQVARQQAEAAAHPHVVFDPDSGVFAPWTRALTIAAGQAPEAFMREVGKALRGGQRA